LGSGRLSLGAGDHLLLGLHDDPRRPVVPAEVLELRGLLDAAEEPVELGAGQTALGGLGDRSAERAAVDGGVLAVEEERALRVGELGNDLGECRVAVERRAGGRVGRGDLRTATLRGAAGPLHEGRGVVDRLGGPGEDGERLALRDRRWAAVLLDEAADGGPHLVRTRGEELAEAGADALDLEVAALAADAVAELLQSGGELCTVDGASLGGDAEQLAAVDGHPLPVSGPLRHVGDDDVVVELRVGDLAAGVLLVGEAGSVMAEPGGDESGRMLVDDLVLAEAAADQGNVALDVAEGNERRLLVGGLDV